MKKIVFGITNLSLGGAEKVLVDLANKLCDKYDITIFTIYGNGEFEKNLSPKVKLYNLFNNTYEEMSKINKIILPLKIFFNKKRIYKKNIEGKYNTEIAFLEGPITNIFSVKSKGKNKIAWIHNDISLVFGNNFKAKIKKLINQKLYNKYKKLIFVSEDNLKKFNEIYKEKVLTKKQVIYNYISPEVIIQKSNQIEEKLFNNDNANFLCVSRLVEQKAIDRLIKIHTKLIKEGIKNNIYIIGDGPLKHKLKKQIQEAKVQDTFILLGKKENPYPYIKQCDYFCLLSYYEGYGMVIEEAKILEKFIIITNTAAREAIKQYKDSYIVDNSEEGIYNGLKQFILNKDKYTTNKNRKSEKFNNDNIIKKIEAIL